MATVDISAANDINKILDKISFIHHSKIIKSALRKAANHFKNRYAAILPRSGESGEDIPLSKTIKVKVIDNKNSDRIVAVIGESRQGKQYIAHLIEKGYILTIGGKAIKKVAGTDYMNKAWNMVKSDVDALLIKSVSEAVKEAAR